MNISLAYPGWTLILCIALGIIFSWAMYAGKRNLFIHRWQYVLVSVLRGLVVTFLAILILSPVIKYISRQEEKPKVIFIQDNSSSISQALSPAAIQQYKQAVNDCIQKLSTDYQVVSYAFGDEVKDSLLTTFDQPTTDISHAIEYTLQTHENENVGAVVLASDGIYNKGMSPLSLTIPCKGSLYTVGVGDTTVQRDATIARVYANKIMYIGDQFALRTDLAAFSARGLPLVVSIFHHNTKRTIFSQTITADADRFTKSLETILTAAQTGIQHFTVSVAAISGERNLLNNKQDIYIEVLDNKQQILIVAQAPHPDIFALQDALKKNKNYQVSVKIAQQADVNLSNVDLLILHNLPSATYNMNSMVEKANQMGISRWYIVGSQTSLPLLNKQQNCVQIASKSATMNDAQAVLQPNFSLFSVNPNLPIQFLPPLSVPFAEYTQGPQTHVYMNQKIGSVQTTYPLWIFQQQGQSRIGVTMGEGIWRWRMYDYKQHKNYQLVDECITKTTQYLAVKKDKKQFNVHLAKSVFAETEPIQIDATLYNENYEPINTPNAELVIVYPDGSKKKYNFDKENNDYHLNIGNLSAGNYQYNAETKFNGKNWIATGQFSVVSQDIESMHTTADFGMLHQLAKNYRGEFIYANQLNTLADKIKQNPTMKTIIRAQVTSDPLINWKSICILIAICLAAEWFIRKYSGNY